jgi:hypothetical protein
MQTIVKELLLSGNRHDIFKCKSNQAKLKIDRKRRSKVKLYDASGTITKSYITHDTSIKQLKSTKKTNSKEIK